MEFYLQNKRYTVNVIIPCYNVTKQVLNVIKGINAEVSRIYVVDDCCPERSGAYVLENCSDERVVVLKNELNLGVGGAVMRGYEEAINDGATVIVKIDGDGQMDPTLINRFVRPILEGRADYTKGNRFFYLEEIRQMPRIRIFGNAILSFILDSRYFVTRFSLPRRRHPHGIKNH